MQSVSVRTANVSVSGISCASCAGSIKAAVTERPGVEAVDVNVATGAATVEYDPAEGSLAQIYEAVEAAGYEPERAIATVGIAGMSCASCATSTTEAIEAVPGVLGADVNVATDEATVTVNPNDASMAAVYDAVEAAGYEPDRPGADTDAGTDVSEPAPDHERAVERELRTKRRWVVVGGLLTAPFLLVMAEMLFGAVLSLPAWIDWVEFGLATALMGTLGRHFLAGAYTAATNGRANMDTLVTVGTTTGYLYSTAVLTSVVAGGLYFEAVAFVLWFIYVGEYLEVRSKARASDALRELLELQAEEATVVEWETDTATDTDPGTDTPTPAPTAGSERVVPVEAVAVGDVLKIRPGGRIPTDGTVVGGQSGVDESMVTGESVPVDKTPGDEVLGGTINEGGVLYIEATSVGEDTAIRQIVQRVKQAQSRQPDVQRLVDRVSAYFVPAVIGNAILWGLAWALFPGALSGAATALGDLLPVLEPVGGGPGPAGISTAEFAIIVFASAVLIACPCALGLATPMATMVGSTISAKNGVLFDGADVLEQLRNIDTVAFDKTGTLTHGEMTVTDVVPVGEALRADGGAARRAGADESLVLSVAASAESGSEHPIATAVIESARSRGLALDAPEQFESVPGLGIRAEVAAGEAVVGNRTLVRQHGIDPAPAAERMDRLERDGKTAMLVGLDDELLGVIAVADTVRESARETIDTLHGRGLEVVMLTGDTERTGRAIADQLGIPAENVRAEVLPEEKADAVETLQADGSRAVMVGDGVNDAPALTAAHVGIAVGSGTDVAIESADITLVRDNPADVRKAIRIADGTIAKVRQNLFWAFAYNATLLPIASIGLLNPAVAGGAMAASSVSVVSNSLAFMRWDPDSEYRSLPRRPAAWARRRFGD